MAGKRCEAGEIEAAAVETLGSGMSHPPHWRWVVVTVAAADWRVPYRVLVLALAMWPIAWMVFAILTIAHRKRRRLAGLCIS
jgi:hypothetical protein